MLKRPARGGSGRAGKAGPDRRRSPGRRFCGLFVALYRGLFREQGQNVRFVPAVSSETVIADQVDGQYDITGGNYVSYIQAQQSHRADLDIFAEGSVLQPGAMGIYTMPGSPAKTLDQLKGQMIAVNAPRNIPAVDHGLERAGFEVTRAAAADLLGGFPGHAASIGGSSISAVRTERTAHPVR